MKFHIALEHRELGETTIEAENIEQAVKEGREWAKQGSWDQAGTVQMQVWSGETGYWEDAEEFVSVAVEVPRTF